MQRAQAALSQGDAAEQGWSTRLDAGNRPFELTGYLNSPLTLRIIDRAGFSLFPLINGLRQPLWLTNETISDGGAGGQLAQINPTRGCVGAEGQEEPPSPRVGSQSKVGQEPAEPGVQCGNGNGDEPLPELLCHQQRFSLGLDALSSGG